MVLWNHQIVETHLDVNHIGDSLVGGVERHRHLKITINKKLQPGNISIKFFTFSDSTRVNM